VGVPNPRSRRVRRPDAGPRQRTSPRRADGVHQAEGRGARRGYAGRHRPARPRGRPGRRRAGHASRIRHPHRDLQTAARRRRGRARPSAVRHRARRDAVLFPDGVALFGETSDLITTPDQGRAVGEALGRRRAVLLANHGVVAVGRNVPWAVLAAITLERAVRIQAIARSLGPLHSIPMASAERLHPSKYQDQLVEEYWASWIRRVRRAREADGMPPD
jgi:hypothetical protein